MFSPEKVVKMQEADARLMADARYLVTKSRELISWSEQTVRLGRPGCDNVTPAQSEISPPALIQLSDANTSH